jgi:hypothetical protein
MNGFFRAFSWREPVSTSLENALNSHVAQVSRASLAMTGYNTTLTPSGTNIQDLMREFGVAEAAWHEGGLILRSPVNGAAIAEVKLHAQADVDRAIHAADAAFQVWCTVPAPKRGELVRLFAEELRVRKTALGRLVAIESGKILQEGLGEVQEMIDICGFAAGLSRQLYGRTIASERPGHRMMETWHPLGVVGIISAFNFPVAVWAWNAAIALVCGDTLVWKPSEKTPLCALACQALLDRAAKGLAWIPPWLSAVILGGPELGQALAGNPLVPLVSATGSTRMGRAGGKRCLEGLYAAGHQHDQFFEGIAARAGHPLRSAARRAQQSELGLTGSLAMDPRASRVPEDWGHGFAGSCALADAAAHARF